MVDQIITCLMRLCRFSIYIQEMSGDHDAIVSVLHHFVDACEKNSAVLHDPTYAFYREYLERWI
jgi:hypothetical protein